MNDRDSSLIKSELSDTHHMIRSPNDLGRNNCYHYILKCVYFGSSNQIEYIFSFKVIKLKGMIHKSKNESGTYNEKT